MTLLQYLPAALLTFPAAPLWADTHDVGDVSQYIELARQLPSQPRFLLDEAGDTVELNVTGDGSLVLAQGEIIESSGAPTSLPDNVLVKPFRDVAGAYLLEHVESEKAVFRLARFASGQLLLGRPHDHPLVPGALITLQAGAVGLYALASNGVTYVDPLVATIDGGDLAVAASVAPQQIQAAWHKLGMVLHPETGEPGLALFQPTAEPKALIVFEEADPIEISADRGVELFAAYGGTVLAGFFNQDCSSAPGTPPGLCTPYVYDLQLSEIGSQISLADFSGTKLVVSPVPGWTFGANHRIYEASDFAVVEGRVYVISYRGMTQSLLYYDLAEPDKYHVVLQPQQGSNIEILQVNGDAGDQSLIVKRSSLIADTQIIKVGPDGAQETLAEVPNFPEDQANDLLVATFDRNVAQGIAPFVMVGNASIVRGDYCQSGLALVEVYGGLRRPLRARNPLGLVPDLLSKDGILVLASIQGSGGFGTPWAQLGAFENSPRQIRSVRDTVQLLRNTGCDNISVTGFSHGGVVALNALLTYPEVVTNVIVGAAPLDFEREFEAGNDLIAAFLPRGNGHFGPNGTLMESEREVFGQLSPSELARNAPDLSGTSITIFVGSRDRLAESYTDETTIEVLRDKGAKVTVIRREGVAHTKFANASQWAEYHAILGLGLELLSDPKLGQ